MKKLLGIVVLGLLLSGCQTYTTKDFAEELSDLREKKMKTKEQCLKDAKDQNDDAEKILANYKVCMVEKGYKPDD